MTKKKEQLATTYHNEQTLHWSFWLGVSFFVLVIVAICSLAWFVRDKMSADESAPVTSVVISGEMVYTQKTDIEQAIDSINLSNFFNVDVNQVQNEVANLPWVYSVSVRKKWPNELKIYVVDQTPVAYWNGDFLINQQGVAFQADINRIQHPLPAFYGPEGSEIVALDNYINLSELLDYRTLAIDELVLSERFSWQLTLNDGVTLNLGREERVQRIQRFMDIYPLIKKNIKADQQVDYVDLRYDTGLAVGWKPLTVKERV
ncbi:cell division protein FtsQ/DivIB [Colwellia sp. 1_MG-2023]|uniref:cell division protein FtsQ/DivIB n=1 Tax=Colwellia sp. 1_MG-2023 TaxID=3062649 RepID=UPI0026E3C149|nr:cell division protein FtsQ/DivIB [Colwellia sp. 1_MG-2023]MDO6444676.1 cell division protein FtsQ/DivIB [Colwellia sp. 1_MG-2023]